MPTPGHTRGHLVFADLAGGLLFAGDHVLPHITPSIGFEGVPEASPLGSYLASLRLIREMPDMRLLPAHGPVTDSVHARVDALLDHHGERLDACAAAVAAGSGTAYETARALTWTRRERLIRRPGPVQPDAGDHRDARAPGGARRPGPAARAPRRRDLDLRGVVYAV